jgi:hypothetical protein
MGSAPKRTSFGVDGQVQPFKGESAEQYFGLVTEALRDIRFRGLSIG